MTARTAIVTGASRGIGLEIARMLVQRGANVTITGRDPESLERAVLELDAPGRVLAVAGNSGDAEHRRDAVARTIDHFGGLDQLVNNTGINPHYGPLLSAEDFALRKVFDTNVSGTLGWIREAHAQAMAEHGGAIVNVTSVAGLRAAGNIGAYGATKAALIHATGQLAVELAPGIRVNAVAPAVIRTRFAEKLYADEAAVAATYPMGRIGTPRDVAGAVCFLLGEDAAWITGQTLAVDGGLTATGGIES